LSCDYVGKGEETNINIPSRNNKMILLAKYIEKFKDMDERELKDINTIIKDMLRDELKVNIMNRELQDYIQNLQYYVGDDWTWGSDVWWPGCLLSVLIFYVLFFVVYVPFTVIILMIENILTISLFCIPN